MRIEFDSVYKTITLAAGIIAFVFGTGAWATRMMYIAESNSQIAKQISRSVEDQTKAIKTLTSTISDHEARLRVNESEIEILQKTLGTQKAF